MSFRAPTRNPGNTEDIKRCRLHTLDSASERGMTVTDRLDLNVVLELIGFANLQLKIIKLQGLNNNHDYT